MEYKSKNSFSGTLITSWIVICKRSKDKPSAWISPNLVIAQFVIHSYLIKILCVIRFYSRLVSSRALQSFTVEIQSRMVIVALHTIYFVSHFGFFANEFFVFFFMFTFNIINVIIKISIFFFLFLSSSFHFEKDEFEKSLRLKKKI